MATTPSPRPTRTPPPARSWLRPVVAGCAVGYGLALAALTLLPVPVISATACKAVGDRWHLVPLRTFGDAASWAGRNGVAAFLTSDHLLHPIANVVLFVPVGLLIGWATTRRLWVAAAAGLGISLIVEASQATAIWGLAECAYRYAEADDVLTNTAGAVLGWFLGRRIGRRLPWPRPAGPA